MTLLELCDKLGATLIIKRMHRRRKLVYSVNIQCVKLFDKEFHSSYETHENALVFHEDINKALYALCDKISGKYVEYGCKEFLVKKVGKGNLSVLGVW